MSTPSSIVGEQNRTGSFPSLNSCSRSSRTSAGTCAVCSRASIPCPSRATSRYRSRKKSLVRLPCGRWLRHPDRVVEPVLAVAGVPDHLRRLDPETRARADP